MTPFLPITLSGATLNERHRQFNEKIREAVSQNIPFDTICDSEEKTPLDALFKVGYADATKNLAYILKSLQNRDMLVVSKALCPWLLEKDYMNIINPQHLEESLFPHMTTTAINKMKHWIALKLRDPSRCAEFYQFYVKKEYDLAVKFLWHCSQEFILDTVLQILDKLTPHTLKILGEKCPQVIKLYFDTIAHDDKVTKVYIEDDHAYFSTLKYFLKSDPKTVLDIYEKYFINNSYRRFSAESTRYIMTNHKERFNNKAELYTAYFLDIKTLATCLSSQEVKDLIYKLARAEYISYWFSFKNVEPIIKRLNNDEQKNLKKEIFVDKKVDNKVEKWPYPEPELPKVSMYYESKIFEDKKDDSQSIDFFEERMFMPKKCAAPNYARYQCMMMCDARCGPIKTETYLEQMFEQYRFTNFENTFAELRKKMTVETVKNRQSIMLVLVSKTGGRPEHVAELMKLLLERHENEPVHIRASVIRSMVKRCCMWRLPQAQWELCLKFARDLGLDGKPSDAACTEGLHAVVLRNLLNNIEFSPLVWEEYLKNFTFFKEYSLTAAERRVLLEKLPSLLLSDAKTHPTRALTSLQQLLNTLKAYNISPDKVEGLIETIKRTAASDTEVAKSFLTFLFHNRVSRKELFEENFSVIQTDMSYFNALKHNTEVLKSGEKFVALVNSGDLNHQRFLRALTLWFGEKDGLADVYFSLLEQHTYLFIKNKTLPRSLAMMARGDILATIKSIKCDSKQFKKLSAALKANAHLARPLVDLEALEYDTFGTKAIANQVTSCSATQATMLLDRLLSRPQTQKLALVISMRVGKEYETLSAVAKRNPKTAIKTILRYQRLGKELDPRVWDIIISSVKNIKESDTRRNDLLSKAVQYASVVPKNRRAEYCMSVFEAYTKTKREPPTDLLRHILKNLQDVEEKLVINMIEDFIEKKWLEILKRDDQKFDRNSNVYISIIARFMMLSQSESSLQNRLALGKKLFDRLKEFWMKSQTKSDVNKRSADFIEHVDTFLLALKCTEVFLKHESTFYLQVFEHVANWMQSFISREVYLDKYTRLHLTMLYSKAIKQGIKNNPEIFKDLSNKLKKAIEIVGIIFGKYISHEVCDLRAKYFNSVIHLYKKDLVLYFDEYFDYEEVREMFIGYVVMGILEGKCESHTIVEYIYNNNQYMINQSFRDKILKELLESQSKEVIFFMNAKHIGDIY